MRKFLENELKKKYEERSVLVNRRINAVGEYKIASEVLKEIRSYKKKSDDLSIAKVGVIVAVLLTVGFGAVSFLNSSFLLMVILSIIFCTRLTFNCIEDVRSLSKSKDIIEKNNYNIDSDQEEITERKREANRILNNTKYQLEDLLEEIDAIEKILDGGNIAVHMQKCPKLLSEYYEYFLRELDNFKPEQVDLYPEPLKDVGTYKFVDQENVKKRELKI